MHKESNHIHAALTEHPVHLAEETEYIINIKYINKWMDISIWLVGFNCHIQSRIPVHTRKCSPSSVPKMILKVYESLPSSRNNFHGYSGKVTIHWKSQTCQILRGARASQKTWRLLIFPRAQTVEVAHHSRPSTQVD